MLKDILKTDISADHKEFRSGDVLHTRADISKAKEILGYLARTGIKEGLVKTVDWYKNNGK
jgi:nucleoside-diphosphate-sugar epimerase